MQNDNMMNSERGDEQERERATGRDSDYSSVHQSSLSSLKREKRFPRLMNQIWPFDSETKSTQNSSGTCGADATLLPLQTPLRHQALAVISGHSEGNLRPQQEPTAPLLHLPLGPDCPAAARRRLIRNMLLISVDTVINQTCAVAVMTNLYSQFQLIVYLSGLQRHSFSSLSPLS